MHRNLDRRVEVLLRVCDETARTRAAPRLRRRHGAGRPLLGAAAATASWTRPDGRDYQAELLERVGELAG